MTLLGVACEPDPDGCTCQQDGRHAIWCLTVARAQPHAMVNDGGDVFYPDNRDDARWFARNEQARPLDPDRFPAGWLP